MDGLLLKKLNLHGSALPNQLIDSVPLRGVSSTLKALALMPWQKQIYWETRLFVDLKYKSKEFLKCKYLYLLIFNLFKLRHMQSIV